MISPVRIRTSHPSTQARPGPVKDTPPKPAPPPAPGWRRILIPLGVLITVILLYLPSLLASRPTSLTYTEFLARLDAGAVQSVTIDDKGSVEGTLADSPGDRPGEDSGGKTGEGTRFTTQIPTALDTSDLAARLAEKNVEITGKQAGTPFWSLVLSFLPLILLIAFFVWTGRQARRQMAGTGTFGMFTRSKAKITETDRPKTRFSDVAGYEGVKQEISEIVDFLRRPEQYRKVGARGPRGVLMVGPPGTGKTLFARAVAGEAEVPFLSITGSSFVEMFVGVGAARVRDLFAEARKRAPSIIFIDEIDAIGSRRGSGRAFGNDEREQTLNQLLAEMDGFDESVGVVVLAATNRPESLDPALLRPGRFDRQVTIPLPNQVERAAILRVHARGKNLAPDVDFDLIARATPGFSGADLANLLNEAAINAIRDGREVVTAADVDAARDRILLGRREASNALLPDEKQAVAVHESGHALVAALSEHADPVSKVSILPAGMTLGVTHQLPEAERHLYSEGYLTDSLAVRLGGRAAELVVFGHGSTGAANDLAGATALATRMVREFGLSPKLGPVGYGSDDGQFLGVDNLGRRPYSEQTQRLIDAEVARLVRDAEQRAVHLLRTHRDLLDKLTAVLLEKETIDGSVVHELVREARAHPHPDRMPPATADTGPTGHAGPADGAGG